MLDTNGFGFGFIDFPLALDSPRSGRSWPRSGLSSRCDIPVYLFTYLPSEQHSTHFDTQLTHTVGPERTTMNGDGLVRAFLDGGSDFHLGRRDLAVPWLLQQA